MIATNDGLKSAPRDMVDETRSLGATSSQVILLVPPPHAFPSILTSTGPITPGSFGEMRGPDIIRQIERVAHLPAGYDSNEVFKPCRLG